MRRLLGLFLVLFLSFSAVAYSLAEDSTSVCSYDFDLRFHMNADVFPARNRSHMQGYADLLNMLELKGNLTYNPASRSVDLNAMIIPVTNPEAAISFRLYGIPEHMGLTSPLLGNETIWFQNYVLMEFAHKTWNNLHIPLQYVTLLYPYVTESAFENLSSAWNSRFSAVRNSGVVSGDELTGLAAEWSDILRTDSRLIYWLYSLSLPVKQGNIMEEEFFRLPDYLLTQVAPDGKLKYSVDDHSAKWTNGQDAVLYTYLSENGSEEWSLTLPATENGYLPQMYCRTVTENDTFSLSLQGSYNQSVVLDSSDSSLPESLFSVSLDMHNWPAVWPLNSSFDAALMIGGIIYPNTILEIRGSATSDGNVELVFSQPVGQNGTETEFFSCTGSVVPVTPRSVPSFSAADFSSHLAIFNVNDMTMDDFIHRVRRPLFFGILNFLNELPASACQSVMDDLEDYGVLDMILVD